MAITVYHANEKISRNSSFYRKDGEIFSGEDAVIEFSRGNYDLVGQVKSDDLETAYMKTNNINSSWIEDKDVFVAESIHEAGGCRSTMTGDILVADDGEINIVAPFGFDRLQQS